jgi:hypothetical protein
MGRAAHLKKARRLVEVEAAKYKKLVASKYAGAKWWQIALSFIWPNILKKPRAKEQEKIDRVYNRAIKKANKSVSHKLADIRAKEAR